MIPNAWQGLDFGLGEDIDMLRETTRGFSDDARARRAERIPMGRFGDVDEVARAALFLASDDASFVTGHTLAVDGGYLAGGLWSRPSRG